MANKGVAEIFTIIDNEPDPVKRQDMLGSCVSNPGVMAVIRLAYDSSIVWNLPPGDPPFNLCPFLDQQAMLYNQVRKLQYFVLPGNPMITKLKREAMFIQFLESLDQNDAKLILSCKNRKLPYTNVNEELVRKTFPNLLPKESVTPYVTEEAPEKVAEVAVETTKAPPPAPKKKVTRGVKKTGHPGPKAGWKKKLEENKDDGQVA